MFANFFIFFLQTSQLQYTDRGLKLGVSRSGAVLQYSLCVKKIKYVSDCCNQGKCSLTSADVVGSHFVPLCRFFRCISKGERGGFYIF